MGIVNLTHNALLASPKSEFIGKAFMHACRDKDGLRVYPAPDQQVVVLPEAGVFVRKRLGKKENHSFLALTFDHIGDEDLFPLNKWMQLVVTSLGSKGQLMAHWRPIPNHLKLQDGGVYLSAMYNLDQYTASHKYIDCIATAVYPDELGMAEEFIDGSSVEWITGYNGPAIIYRPAPKQSMFWASLGKGMITSSLAHHYDLLVKPGVSAQITAEAKAIEAHLDQGAGIDMTDFIVLGTDGKVKGMKVAKKKLPAVETPLMQLDEAAFLETKGSFQKLGKKFEAAASAATALADALPDPNVKKEDTWSEWKTTQLKGTAIGVCPRCVGAVMVWSASITPDKYILIPMASKGFNMSGKVSAKVLCSDQKAMMGTVAGFYCPSCGYAVNEGGTLCRSALSPKVVAPWEEGNYDKGWESEGEYVQEVEIVPIHRAVELIAGSGESAAVYEDQLLHAARQLEYMGKELQKLRDQVKGYQVKAMADAGVEVPLPTQNVVTE